MVSYFLTKYFSGLYFSILKILKVLSPKLRDEVTYMQTDELAIG